MFLSESLHGTQFKMNTRYSFRRRRLHFNIPHSFRSLHRYIPSNGFTTALFSDLHFATYTNFICMLETEEASDTWLLVTKHNPR